MCVVVVVLIYVSGVTNATEHLFKDLFAISILPVFRTRVLCFLIVELAYFVFQSETSFRYQFLLGNKRF